MALWKKLQFWSSPQEPIHLQRGALGEKAARKHLEEQGMKFLTANFTSRRGEIDLVFRDGETLVFVEVKTRTSGGWTRPARAVDARKRLALARTGAEYLRRLQEPEVAYRFDVVEVILEGGQVSAVRHIRNSFDVTRLRKKRRS